MECTTDLEPDGVELEEVEDGEPVEDGAATTELRSTP